MRKTNDTYCVVFRGKRITERYYRDAEGWLKVSARGRQFRATAEQVLNHLLPALAFGSQLGLVVEVEHHDRPYWETKAGAAARRTKGRPWSATPQGPTPRKRPGVRSGRP